MTYAEHVEKLPSEELFESMAARMRPLLLQDDGVLPGKVLTGLVNVVRLSSTDPSLVESLRGFQSRWEAFQGGAGFISIKMEDGSWAASRDIAYAWLYGELIHADKKHFVKFRTIPRASMFHIAVVYFAPLIGLTMDVLEFLRLLDARAVIQLPKHAIRDAVVVAEASFEPRSID